MKNVINWSYAGNSVRFRIPFAVAPDSDIDLVSRLMTEAADENKDVVTEPEPSVRRLKVDGGGLYFELRAWSRVRLHRPGLLKSDLNLAVTRKFREHGVRLADPPGEIRFPDQPDGADENAARNSGSRKRSS